MGTWGTLQSAEEGLDSRAEVERSRAVGVEGDIPAVLLALLVGSCCLVRTEHCCTFPDPVTCQPKLLLGK